MPAFNDSLADRFVRHAIDLEKFKAGQRRKMLAALKKLEQQLVIELAKADLPGYTLTPYQEARIRALISQTRATIGSAYKELRDDQTSDFYKLAAIEAEFIRNSINGLAGVELASVATSEEVLSAVVDDMVIEGGPAAEWWARQAADTSRKYADTVRSGILQGQTTDQLSRRVRSEVMDVSVRNADAMVRTSINSVSSSARLASMEANDDVIEAIQQHSTLDARTTQICMAYSGATYTNDAAHKPLDGSLPYNGGIPRHWSCRSYWIPVVRSFAKLKDLKTGGRPSDAPEYFEARLKAQGLTDSEIRRVVASAQASMDGQVAETFNYESWLKTKPEAFQKEILGPTKFRLWKSGKISFSDLVDQSANPRTVEQLKKLAEAA